MYAAYSDRQELLLIKIIYTCTVKRKGNNNTHNVHSKLNWAKVLRTCRQTEDKGYKML